MINYPSGFVIFHHNFWTNNITAFGFLRPSFGWGLSMVKHPSFCWSNQDSGRLNPEMFVAYIIILDHTSGKIILFFMVKPILFPTQKTLRNSRTAPRRGSLRAWIFSKANLRPSMAARCEGFTWQFIALFFCEWTHFTIKHDRRLKY